MTHRPSRGFTLIEMLVVIVILTILMTLIGSIVSDVITRARYSKTVGIIRVLHEGCERYKAEDMSRKYPTPGDDSTNSTKILHLRLGSNRQKFAQIGMAAVTIKPLVEFKNDWLEGPPANSDPGATGVNIVDSWKVPLRYKQDNTTHLFAVKTGIPAGQSITIRGIGENGIDDAGNVDDVGNWERVGTTN